MLCQLLTLPRLLPFSHALTPPSLLQIGAPFADARFAEAARREVGRAQGDAVVVREAHFVPMWGALKGQKICGVHVSAWTQSGSRYLCRH